MANQPELQWAFGRIRGQLSGNGVDPRRVEELAGIFEGGSSTLTADKAQCVADMLEEVADATTRKIRGSTLAKIKEHLVSAIELCEFKEPSESPIEPSE